MTYPGVFFWLFLIWAVRSKGPALYYLLFRCWSLGTLAVIPPQLSGGNFTPAWVVALVLTAKVALDVGVGRYVGALIDFRRFGFLSLSTLYAMGSAYFLPRLFQGKVNVVGMRLQTAGVSALAPDMANFNQTMYFVLGTLIIVDAYFICRDPAKRSGFLAAFGWGAVAVIVTGNMDLVASKAGLGALLQPFRNAAYAMMLDNDAMNMHRVVGLMSEASSYAALCIPFLSMIALTPAEAEAPWRRWALPLSLLLALMVYLSTSSGGYVSLVGVFATLLASLFIGIALRRRLAWLGGFCLLVGATAMVGVFVLAPDVLTGLYHVFDVMVLHKSSSQSYIERSAWNRVAYQAFLHTDYLGAGAGSARASNWFIAMLGNIGAPGTGLFAIFAAQVVFTRASGVPERLFARAAKLSLIPNFLIICLSGTSISYGTGIATLLGLICALGWAEEDARAPSAMTSDAEKRRRAADAQLIALFVEFPVHAVFFSTVRPIPQSTRSGRGMTPTAGLKIGGAASPSPLPSATSPRPKRANALTRFMESVEAQTPPNLFIHAIVYTLSDERTPDQGRWRLPTSRWSIEFDRFVHIETNDWLAVLEPYLMSNRGLSRSGTAHLGETNPPAGLQGFMKGAGRRAKRLRWIATV